MFYDGDSSLNRAFCAPNKIYEYAGLGIPSIGNKVPGLINTINKYKMGKCVNICVDNLKSAIKDIEKNYSDYSNNAYKFFNSTNNRTEIQKIVNEHLLV